MKNSILLAVDDKPDNLYVIEQLIAAYYPECKVLKAMNAKEGLSIAAATPLDVVVLDVQMPDMDGIEMCRRLKADKSTSHVPVILLTAHRTTSEFRVKGLEAGADDFISKPIDNIELIAKVKVMLRIKKAEDALRRERDQLEDTVDKKTKQLQTIEQQYQTIFNSASDAIFIHDLEGNFLEVNDEACNRLGYTREELLQMTPKNIDSPEYALKVPERIKEMQQKESLFFETVHVTRDGTLIPSELSSRIIEYRGRTAILVIARDIRERKQAEKEREELEIRLRQAQKMEAIGTLAGGIAHDFNNILYPIMGYTEMTMEDLPKDSIERQNMAEVLKAADRAKNLVKQILSFSRQSDQELKPVKIQSIIAEALKLIRSTLPATIEIHQDIDKHCKPVMADLTQIHQILINLCTNAYHAMPEGGILTIKLKEWQLQDSEGKSQGTDFRIYDNTLRSEICDLISGSYLKLSISDTGHGIPSEIMDRIFDPYFTTKETGKGTGLGLSVVHGIVRSHRGYVTVQSTPGKGSTFDIWFPVIASQPSVNHQGSATEPVPTGNESILLVDDEEQLIRMVNLMLERMGYKVTALTSSSEALRLFRSKPEDFDLIITDMTMPYMTGVELSRELIKIRKNIPIILCTGFSERISEEKAREIGIRKFVMKPVVMMELAKAVRFAIEN